MRKFYIKNLLTILFIVLSVSSVYAQQVPNPSFEDWGGEKFDGKEQPASWFVSNIEQVGFKFNLAHKEAGHSGSYSMMVQDTEVGVEALGITEVSPGYFSLGKPWSWISGINTGSATAGTSGGINFKYRPDTMSVWIKRTGGNVDKEDFTCYIMLGLVHPKAVNTKQKAATVPPLALKPTRRVISVSH